MKKHYILDTSVLLHDPRALFNFQENDLYIPPDVVAELDKFKKGNEDINAHAREVIRSLEELTKKGIDEKGLSVGEGLGNIFFHLPGQELPNLSLEKISHEMRDPFADPVLIYWAKELTKTKEKETKQGKGTKEGSIDKSDKSGDEKVCLVTKDLNLRVRARLEGVEAEDYLFDKAALNLNEFFNREVEFDVAGEIIDQLHVKGARILPPAELGVLENNQYLILKHDSQSALAKFQGGKLTKIGESMPVEGLRPRNYSQRFLIDACLDEKITIVAGLGKAGTGKTIVSLAAGLHQIVDKDMRKYDKLVVIRPTHELGKELGFLPGELGEKIDPHFRPIDTALAVIYGELGAAYPAKDVYIQKMPINFVGGDTFHNCFILVDEAQNFTRSELKMIGTRMGQNSKLVVLGDPFQVNHPYLDEKSNGLTVMTDKLRGTSKFAYTILEKVERSQEAEIFANYL